MNKITNIVARQILDSRGNPTVETDVYVNNTMFGRASVPSGASTGEYEAVELRDNHDNYYLGKSVLKAVNNINGLIRENLIGIPIDDQLKIDNLMIEIDGTANKSKLGANSILSVSLSCLKAAASFNNKFLFNYIQKDLPKIMPIPMMNIINGGAHADNLIDFQEFMIMPLNTNRFSESLRIGVEIFHTLKQVLKSKGFSTNVGDEGGFAPNLKSNTEALEIITIAIEKAGYSPGKDVFISLDVAASEFYDKQNKLYKFKGEKHSGLNSSDMTGYFKKICNKFPIISIEDGLDQDDWDGWIKLSKELGEKVQLVGDDLFVTNSDRIKIGIEKNIANSVLIKLNQIGTFSETLEAINLAKLNNYSTIMSHRSGETEDSIISDISVGLSTGQIKTGSASRSDRISKYNQLLRIEEILGESAIFLGKNFKYI